MRGLLLALVVVLGTFGVTAAEEGLVPILCANAYRPMPGEGAVFEAYAEALAEIIENDTSLGLTPVVVHSPGEFVEYLAYPQTYVGVVSYYGGKMGSELEMAIEEIFKRGLGLVGMNMAATQSNLSYAVFPVAANMTSPGKLGISGGKLVMGHNYVKSADHPITEGLPEEVFFSDVELYWTNCSRLVTEPPSPPEGSIKVVFKTKEKNTCYADDMIPAVVAYENVGRSVSMPAFGLTERKGADDYSGVVYDPQFQTFFLNSLRWAAEAGAASYEERMDELESRVATCEQERANLIEEASDWKKKASSGRTLRLAIFTILGVLGIAVVYRLTFMSGEGEGD